MKKLLSLVLALSSVLCMAGFAAGSSAADTLKKQEIDYTELLGRVNQSDSGFTRESTYIYSGGKTSMTPRNDFGFQFYYFGLENWSSGMLDSQGNPLYEDRPLDDWYLDFIDQTLANLRKNGGACIIRGTYALNGEENAEPATFEMLQTHQMQLASVFKKYPDVIVAVECGMIGQYGEMHHGKYSGSNDKCSVLTTWLEELPDEITVNVRTQAEYLYMIQTSPIFKEKYKSKTVNGIDYPGSINPGNYFLYTFDDEIFGRIGIYNDAMIQDGNDGGTIHDGSREDFCTFLQSRASVTSYGGEFSGAAGEYRYERNTWLPMKAIPEFYKVHLAYYHGGNIAYQETGEFKYGTYTRKSGGVNNTRTYKSETEAATKAEQYLDWCEQYGSGMEYNAVQNGTEVIYTSGGWSSATVGDALIDAIGASIDLTADLSAYLGQSVATFFEDHIGYRIVLKESYLSESVARGGVLSIKGAVDNTGFTNISRDKVTEIVLTDGQNTYTARTDIDANSWIGGSRNAYDVSLKLPGSIPAGEYEVYLRVAAKDADGNTNEASCIRFANPGQFQYSVLGSTYSVGSASVSIIYNSNLCANYIGSVTVTEKTTDFSDDSFKQVTASFDDIDHWAKQEIIDICSLGYMNGMSKTTFQPDGTTTRAMIVTVLYNLEGQPDVSAVKTPFKDIPAGRYFTAPVAWAYENKIVDGMSSTTFNPTGVLTREQFATILYRYAQYKGVDVSDSADLSQYADGAKVSNFAKTTLAWANAKGLITGMTKTTLVPQGSATRAQMATILMRYFRSTAQ